ncbi:NAD(P)/FAD-dependent oxidoreductase, partial [Fulvivirga lutimaris]|uniref:NAD(P)/FAD-dependent oxidoreductase n=1 Tax=Fulvivirga lutimaris TaxID=1819566 RepID=UPI0012BC6B61
VIGGGLAGLVSAILLQKEKLNVVLVEKKQYPFHRVCGEYVSNEVVDFLKRNNIYPNSGHSELNEFALTSIAGKKATVPLELGGFGISRYNFDFFLFKKAQEVGVHIVTDAVDSISYIDDQDEFVIDLRKSGQLHSKIAIGAYGKRSNIDRNMNRPFFSRLSPYIGVKYHIKYDHPINQVALHNFEGGYCGINAIEEGKMNLCYLGERSALKKHGSIPEMERNVLHRNPYLKKIFMEAEFLWEKPEVINEISFETKKPVEGHILMCGDAAGMITPLCGNGMAMAIHSSNILVEDISNYFHKHNDRMQLEKSYRSKWNKLFKTRLSIGRTIQNLFGSVWLSELSVGMCKIKPLSRYLVSLTHGKPF